MHVKIDHTHDNLKYTLEELDYYDDVVTGYDDVLESQFRLVNSKESKRNKDAKMNKANKWKIKG